MKTDTEDHRWAHAAVRALLERCMLGIAGEFELMARLVRCRRA